MKNEIKNIDELKGLLQRCLNVLIQRTKKIFIKMSEGKRKLLFGDCLELMKLIPTGSVDLVVTDPPYEIEDMKP